jgi:hypothetical protein
MRRTIVINYIFPTIMEANETIQFCKGGIFVKNVKLSTEEQMTFFKSDSVIHK